MTLRITIDIFSGRPNPVIELTGKEEKDALERLQPGSKIKKGEMGLPPEPTLGYRGMVIEKTGVAVKGLPRMFRLAHGDMFGEGLANRAADEAFEDFVCGTKGLISRLRLGPAFPELVKKSIKDFRIVRAKWPWDEIVRPPIIRGCPCGPLYEPTWWNDAGQKQDNNNCYNYGCNYRTDTYAQPGLASGVTHSLTCATVKTAAVADGLINTPKADNKCPDEGHLVAMAIWPGWDYHWYRKGRNAYWSHKPGWGAVTNKDNSNASISDPRTANRGGYTDFCTFMVVQHGHIKIK